MNVSKNKKIGMRPVLAALVWLLLAVPVTFAGTNLHDFRQQDWSKARSCAICHELHNGLLPVSPTYARPVDSSSLSAEENQAIQNNPQNKICLVCHQSNGAIVGQKPLAPLPIPNPQDAPRPGDTCSTPAGAAGTHGSVCARVNNQGVMNADCLSCHAIHNFRTQHLLRDDYGQFPAGQ